jgi:hypothetical protein
MNMDNYWFNAVYSLTPTIAVGVIFVFVMRSIIKLDSRERKAFKKIEEEERERAAQRRAARKLEVSEE